MLDIQYVSDTALDPDEGGGREGAAAALDSSHPVAPCCSGRSPLSWLCARVAFSVRFSQGAYPIAS